MRGSERIMWERKLKAELRGGREVGREAGKEGGTRDTVVYKRIRLQSHLHIRVPSSAVREILVPYCAFYRITVS